MEKTTRVVPFRMWDRINNFGDAVNPHIIKLVSGLEPVKVGGGDALIGIGSLLQKSNEHSYVWGTGLMHSHMVVRAKAERIRAVRGRRTLEELRARGILDHDVPLGDPGVLVGRYAEQLIGTVTERRYRACVIPHHASRDDRVFKLLRSNPDVKVVNMRSTSLETLRDIAESEVVLSQSLHGLIFAEALGRPSLWISINQSPDWRFKFEDWYSNTLEPQAEPVPYLRKGPLDIEGMSAAARLCGLNVDQDALIAAFPFDCAVERDTSDLVTFEEGRAQSSVFVRSPALDPVQGRKLHELEEADRRQLERELKLPARDYFKNWAESRYSIIGNDPFFDDRRIYAAVQTIMDKHSNVKFAFLRRSAEKENATGRVVKYRSIYYALGDDTIGPCIVARPDLGFSFVEGSTLSIFF